MFIVYSRDVYFRYVLLRGADGRAGCDQAPARNSRTERVQLKCGSLLRSCSSSVIEDIVDKAQRVTEGELIRAPGLGSRPKPRTQSLYLCG